MSDQGAGDELQAAFLRAAKVVEGVPDSLKPIAFQRALDEILGSRGAADTPPGAASGARAPKQTAPPKARRAGSGGRQSENDVVARLLESLDRTELADLMAGRKVLDRALLVLRAAQHHGIEAMSATEIADVLTQKFRERTNRNAVQMALERAPQFTDRRTRDGTVVYALMASGERYLEAATKGEEGTGAGTPRGGGSGAGGGARKGAARSGGGGRKTRTARSNTTPPTDGEDAGERGGSRPKAEPPAPRNGRKAAGRPGPKALLEELLAQGVFDTPQTIGSLLALIERKRGHRYNAGDFSPALTRLLREDKLDRDRNAEGQYEYRKHGSA